LDGGSARHKAATYTHKQKEGISERQINEPATQSKNKNIRDLYKGINKFMMGYESRSNLVKEENGDLLAHLHNILKRKNYFSVIECTQDQ
jgi:hypothetical protein